MALWACYTVINLMGRYTLSRKSRDLDRSLDFQSCRAVQRQPFARNLWRFTLCQLFVVFGMVARARGSRLHPRYPRRAEHP